MRNYVVAHLIFLTLTAPWIFLAVGREATVAGLPLWAVYTVATAAAYAVFVSLCIAKLWFDESKKGES